MRAMQFQQAGGAALVAKCDQILAEDLDPIWQVAQFVGKADRLPKAAQIFAARRARADMGEFRIFFRNIAVEVAAIPRLQERGSGRHDKPPLTDRLEPPV